MAFKKNSRKKTGTQVADTTRPLTVALDVGSSTIRIAAGYVDARTKQIELIGYLEKKSFGVKQGAVSDLESVAANLTSLFQEFREKYHIEIEEIRAGVPGCFVSAENQRGSATVTGDTVSISDRNRAIENARARVHEINLAEYQIIHTNPQNYITDNSEQITNPIGLYARNLDVNVHVIACKTAQLRNIEQCIRKTSPDIKSVKLYYNGNATVAAGVYDTDKDIGVISIDVGQDTTSITVYENKKQLISLGFEDGANYINKAISASLGVPIEIAESIKFKCGYAFPDRLTDDQKTHVVQSSYTSNNEEIAFEFTLGQLSQVIYDSYYSMFEVIFQRIYNQGARYLEQLNIGAGVVLSGGGVKMPGLDFLVQYILQKNNATQGIGEFLHVYNKIRFAIPNGISVKENAISQNISIIDQDKLVITGLLRSAVLEDINAYSADTIKKQSESKSILGKMVQSFKNWVTTEL